MKRYNIMLPDRQLACAPAQSEEGQNYLGAMRAAANFAWANRQAITAFPARSLPPRVWRERAADADLRRLPQHRQARGARGRRREARGAGPSQGRDPRLPAGPSRDSRRLPRVGQPVLIPGSMGTASWVLVGSRRSNAGNFRQRLPRRRPPHEPYRRKKGADAKQVEQQKLEERGIWSAAKPATASSKRSPKPTKMSTKSLTLSTAPAWREK